MELEESKVFLTTPLRQKVFKFMSEKPNANIFELYHQFKDANPGTLKVYRSHFRKEYRKNHSINWKSLKLISDLLNFKVVPGAKFTKDDREALKYFEKLVNKNFKEV